MESVETLEAAITESQCEVIFNLAGLYAWWAPDNGSFRRANVDSVRNLLAAITNVQSDPAPRSLPKLIHVSTVLAYGRTSGGLTPETAFTEASPAGPCSSAYAASKAEGDRLALAAFQAREVSGCILYLACCLGADHKLVDPRRDVMRIAELISGSVPATITSDTIFTYVHVRDAAEAITRAAELRGNDGERYLVGDQRLRTQEYYVLLAEVSGTPAPRFEVPGWAALGWARLSSFVATSTPPVAPADLVRTAVAGTLLFDAAKSKTELRMSYTPVRQAIEEAVALIRAERAQQGKL
ncbi:unnamed protein product [Polarella glacialis]|uniref:NAD-dependent epimerase/dehydratase domain-containing protein n=1 Tax=Polarella glacialis TaxID=89957 RepID=A0A813JVB7_POLGL|nr:unnamed protein product [Polarella glacialis]CAE8683775.1 unnamed protein product [Polarella glacialis]